MARNVITLSDLADIDARNEGEAERLVLALRWPDGVACTRCTSRGLKGERIKPLAGYQFTCLHCDHTFNSRSGTLFAATTMPWTDIMAMARIYRFATNLGYDPRDYLRMLGRDPRETRRWAAIFGLITKRGHIHIDMDWVERNNALAEFGYDQKNDAAALVAETRSRMSALSTFRPATPNQEDDANERTGRLMQGALARTYRHGTSPALTDEDRKAIAAYLEKNPVSVVKEYKPAHLRRKPPKLKTPKPRANAPYKAGRNEQANLRAQEAVEWIIETGMLIREAIERTGASHNLVVKHLKKAREAGANLRLFDDNVAQRAAIGGTNAQRNAQLKKLEEALKDESEDEG